MNLGWKPSMTDVGVGCRLKKIKPLSQITGIACEKGSPKQDLSLKIIHFENECCKVDRWKFGRV